MSAILTHVYSISDAVDLSSFDAAQANNQWQLDLEYADKLSGWRSTSDLEQSNSKTSLEDFCIKLDKTARTLTRQRLFSTISDADAKKTWITANVPGTFGIFSFVSAVTQDSAVLTESGFVTA